MSAPSTPLPTALVVANPRRAPSVDEIMGLSLPVLFEYDGWVYVDRSAYPSVEDYWNGKDRWFPLKRDTEVVVAS